MKPNFSPEFMNAFVDGELTASEREAALARLESDEAFKTAVCETRTMKEMVRGAYGSVQSQTPSKGWRCAPVWRQALAAGLMLSLGLAGGWFARGGLPDGSASPIAGLPTGFSTVSLASQVDPNKIILHVDSSDPARLKRVLVMAEDLLQRQGDKVQVEVLANSDGLNLLRADKTPYRDVIEKLSRDHANLAFLACAQTVARLQREGTKVVLLPEASMASSAINEILSRMQQGWVYVKV